MMLGRISGSPPVPVAPPGWDRELEGGEIRAGGRNCRDLEGFGDAAPSEEEMSRCFQATGGNGSSRGSVNITTSRG
jgi:hypothetical protein